MMQFSVEPRARKYVKGYGFLSFVRKYKKQLLGTELDAVNTASRTAVNKAGEFLGNKIADTVTKSSNNKIIKPDENSRNMGEIIIPLEKRYEILNKLRKVL